MRQQIDISLDFTTDDLVFANGDFVAAESTLIHQKNLLQHGKGQYKDFPLTGVGAEEYLNDEDPNDFLQEVHRQFSKDGMRVKSVKMVTGKLQVDAEYK